MRGERNVVPEDSSEGFAAMMDTHSDYMSLKTCSDNLASVIFSLFIPAVLTKYVQVWNSHKTQL